MTGNVSEHTQPGKACYGGPPSACEPAAKIAHVHAPFAVQKEDAATWPPARPWPLGR